MTLEWIEYRERRSTVAQQLCIFAYCFQSYHYGKQREYYQTL